MALSDLQRRLLQRLGLEFKAPELFQRALTHRSHSSDHNERLEFLGDSILNFIIAEALYQKFPEAPEGDLSRMRAALVKGKTLAEIARQLDIGECLNLGSGEMKSGGFRRDSILADAVEAIIGAYYLDAGQQACKQMVLDWFSSRLDSATPQNTSKDAKTRLQELLQAVKKPLPVYHLVATSGEQHSQQFRVACEIAHIQRRFSGEGGSRRVAEQQAAQAAIDHLEKRL